MTDREKRYPEIPAFVEKMRAAGLHAHVVEAFLRLYCRLREGDPGKLPWVGVSPPDPADLVPYESLEADRARGCGLLGQLVVISLNGGLGTTMKLERAKSLIPVRAGQSFLDLVAQQILKLRAAHGVRVPWLLMDSFHTSADSLEALGRYPELPVPGLPLDFLQNKFPRIVRATRLPLALEDDDENWAPPGHGDIYLALFLTGLLDRFLERGIRWAFVSNIDNLGSTVDPCILGYLEREGLDFAMEVAPRTLADIKGGPLIRFRDPGGRSRLMLLERTQVEEQHLEKFADLSSFSVFNTNSLWWRVEALRERVRAWTLELPMIVNPKTVRGVDVVQLETAQGAAIGSFERAKGIRVPRSRFAPVKATCDLLAVRSDAYVLDESSGIRPAPGRPPEWGPPVIQLDDSYYKGLADLEARIPHPPSLVGCRRLTVQGDVRLGRGVRVAGEVTLSNDSAEPWTIADGTELKAGTYKR